MALVAQTGAQRTKARRESQAPGAGDRQGDLAEVFGARLSDVEEMILARLEERSWSEEGRWRERFCLDE